MPEKTNQLNLHIVGFNEEDMIPEEEDIQNAFDRFLGDEEIEKQCPVCGDKQNFTKKTRFLNFPEVMIIVTQRFTFQNWTPTKVNTSVKVALENLDFMPYLVKGGIQDGEIGLPDEGEVEVEIDVEVNQEQLNQCIMMGIPELPAKHALVNTGN